MQDELFRQIPYYACVVVSIVVGCWAALMVLGKQLPSDACDLLIAGSVQTFIVGVPLGLVYYARNIKSVEVFGAELPTPIVVGVVGAIGIILLARGYQKAKYHAKGGVR